MSAQPNSRPSADEYAAKLVTATEAAKRFKMDRATFWRFRKRHHIRLLTGRRVHLDDVVRGFESERSR